MLDRHITCPVLIGRRDELAALQELLSAAQQGRGGLVVVGGDGGVGKTRLCRELKLIAAQQQVRVIEGRSSAAESMVPYGPFMDALRFRIGRGEGDAAAHVLQPVLAHVAPLFTQLAGAHADGRIAQPSAAPFEPIFATLRRLSALGPILFIVEDIHWADATSRDLLQYIARRVAGLSMLMVATCRTDDIHTSHPVHRLIASLQRERVAARIELDPLTFDETRQMVDAMLGAPVDATFLSALCDRTEGNPLFIEERISALEKLRPDRIQSLRAEDLADTHAPATLHEIVSETLSPLSAEAREVLTAAAVIGRRFRFDVLAASLAWDESNLLSVMEELVDARIIVEHSGQLEESYSFRHTLLQEVIYDSTIGPRRRMWHRKVAAAMEDVRDAEKLPHTFLAHHYSLGGDLHRARVHAVLAGDEAARLCAWKDAATMYEDALLALEREGGDADVEADLLERLADVAWWQNELAVLEKYLVEALAIRRSLGDRRRAAMLLRKLANLDAYQRSDMECALLRLEEARSLLEDEECAERVFVLNDLGRLQLKRGDWAAAHQLFEQGLQLGARLGDCAEEALSLVMLGWLAVHEGQIAAGAARLELARALLVEEPVPAERAMEVYHAGIRALEAAREPGPARAWLDAALAYANTHATAGESAVYRAYDAAVRRRAGDWASALRAAEEAVAELRSSGRAQLRGALRILGDVQRSRGELAPARASYEEALSLGETDAAIGYAMCLMAEERWAEASARLSQALQIQPDNDRLFALRVLPILIEARALAGDLAAARAALADLRELVAGSDYRAGSAALAQAGGVVHVAAGETAAALRELRQAAEAWHALELPYEAARARLMLAALLISAGRGRKQALELARAALHEFEKMGAALDSARAKQLLRRGGVRVRARKRRVVLPEPLGKLTGREVEVLFEVARGYTNKQIARTLSMSPRTVGNHVSAILAKLECSTRTEAARMAATSLPAARPVSTVT